MQKDKIRRLEAEIKALKEENKRKEESLSTCRVDLLQLEKEKGSLSAVSYENKALKENCALLERSLEKFNDCQGKVSILEHSLFKSQETVHDKEEKIAELQRTNNELKKRSKVAQSDLSKEKQEVHTLKIGLESANALIEKAKESEANERGHFEKLCTDFQKLNDEKLKLEKSYQVNIDMAADLKIQLDNRHHMGNVLEDRMKTVNLHLQEKEQALDLMDKDKSHREKLHKSEIAQLNAQMEKAQRHSGER
jgi:chromosome segregation ATPase